MWCDVCSTWHVTLARNLVILLRWVDVSHCLVSLCCLRSSLFLSHGSRSLSLVSVALCSSRVVLGLSHLCLSGWSSCRLSLGLCRLFVVLSLFFLSCGYETLVSSYMTCCSSCPLSHSLSRLFVVLCPFYLLWGSLQHWHRLLSVCLSVSGYRTASAYIWLESMKCLWLLMWWKVLNITVKTPLCLTVYSCSDDSNSLMALFMSDVMNRLN